MTTICKPIVNRASKMVPEGGFEPPTRGFSINVQPSICAGRIVNRQDFGVNNNKYLAKAAQTESTPTNAQMIAELQLAAICFRMGVPADRVEVRHG